MKTRLIGKFAILIGLIAMMSSCQKDEMPSPDGCPTHDESGSNLRLGDPSGNENGNGGFLGNDGGVTGDSIVGGGDDGHDGGDIIGGGDDDRDGGGVVGGGDSDRDGGGRKANTDKGKRN